MQRVTLVRYAAKPERADENEALSRAVFDQLRAKAPKGVIYALFRQGDDFVHLFVNFEAEDSAALTELPAFKRYAENVGERCATPPEPLRLNATLLEAYGVVPAMADA